MGKSLKVLLLSLLSLLSVFSLLGLLGLLNHLSVLNLLGNDSICQLIFYKKSKVKAGGGGETEFSGVKIRLIINQKSQKSV